MKGYYWPADDGRGVEKREIPAELKAEADHWRHELVEALAEFDEEVMEAYIGEEEITAPTSAGAA